MANLSQFLASTSPKAIQAAGPGSNGYWRRELWLKAGSFSFTVKKSGKHKIYAGGAGGGGGWVYPGASAGLSCDERDFVAGDVITLTLGAGGAGNNSTSNGSDGGSTTIVCAARGLNLVLTGATGGRSGGTGMTAGTATGGNVFNRNGAVPAAGLAGGCSMASPFANGFASTSYGGAGWGGGAISSGGASSHSRAFRNTGARGLTSPGGTELLNPPSVYLTVGTLNGASAPWWDLTDMDGGGGAGAPLSGPAGDGGVGAGGGGTITSSNSSPGAGGFGGGGGASSASGNGGDGGNGAGGGSGPNNTSFSGGRGGDAFCAIYWDGVQL